MLTASELGMAEENGELLLMAAMYDQVDFLDELLNAGVHGTVYTRDRFGMTPLHHAAHYGSHRCVEILLQKEGLRNPVLVLCFLLPLFSISKMTLHPPAFSQYSHPFENYLVLFFYFLS